MLNKPSSKTATQSVALAYLMDVRCKKCGSEYEFDAARIGPQGVKVKCTACECIFIVQSGSNSPTTRSGTDWLVRTTDDRLVSFEKLTTLQKWIIEGRIEREDEISKDGESWKRMGNVQELEPFFSVFDRASALNDLMNTGTIGEHPILVNGSEVLATTNPLRSARPSTRPSSGQTSSRPQSLIKTQPVQAQSRRPSSLKNSSLPPPGKSSPLSFANEEAEVATNPGNEVTVGMSQPPRVPTSSKVNSSTDLDTGFAGPAALNDIIAEGAVEGDEFVFRFERKNRLRRRILGVGSLIIGGLVGGAVFALYGIPQSPLAKIKNSQVKISDQTSPDISIIETARSQLEKDSLSSIAKADASYLQALKNTPKDTELMAERALVLTIWADSLRRQARHEETKLTTYQSEQKQFSSKLTLYEDLPPRAKAGSSKPIRPEPLDEKAISASIEELRKKASSLTRDSFELLRESNEAGQPTITSLRALADYYRVQRDPKAAEYLAQAKQLTAAAGQSDPLTMYIEAATKSIDLEKQTISQREQSVRLLEEVLTLRPTLVRARVLLARILIAQNSVPLAKENLERVLKESPDHTEAQQMLAKLQTIEKAISAKKVASEKEQVPPEEPAVLPARAKQAKAPAKKKARVSKNGKSTSYSYYLKQGRKLRKDNLPWKALLAYEKASAIRKSSAAPYIGIGWCYLELGKPIAAKNQFKKASLVDPRSADAQLGLGRALTAQGKIDAAVEHFEKVLDMAPRSRAATRARKTIREIRASE